MNGERWGFRPLVVISGLPVGGAETVTVQFLRHLRATDRSVPVCTLTDQLDGSPARALDRAGVPRFDLGARRLADWGALTRLLRLVRRHRIDLLHAHGQDASILAAAATLLRPMLLVVTRHVLDEPAATLRERGRAHLTTVALRRADAVVAVSGAVADTLVASGSARRERIRVIPNGIDLCRFDTGSLDRSRADARRSLSVDERTPVVLVPAVLREGKGHDHLLRALPDLREAVPGVQVLFAGDGEREEELRRQVVDRGLQGSVRFLGFRGDIPELMAAADVVALPSLAEALPTVLLEAAAAGRPVVATRVGGTPEVVEDGRTGVLVPPNDASALCRALVDVLLDPERARTYGRAARSLASARFGVGFQAERTVELWRGLVARRGVPGR